MADPGAVKVPCPYCVGAAVCGVGAVSTVGNGRVKVELKVDLGPLYRHISRGHPEERSHLDRVEAAYMDLRR